MKLKLTLFALILGAITVPQAQAQAPAETEDPLLRRTGAYLHGTPTPPPNPLPATHHCRIT